jgi:hypothetical protein
MAVIFGWSGQCGSVFMLLVFSLGGEFFMTRMLLGVSIDIPQLETVFQENQHH